MDSRTEKLQSSLALFREMPEACMLIDYRSRQNRLTFDDRMAVTRCIETAFAPVFLEMRAESPSLSESDLIFCALAAAGFKPEVISDCISISKESLRMRRKRIKEKLSPFWADQLFPETETVTKSVTGKCYDNGAQHISGADEADLLLRQNQSNAKDMKTKKITFGEAIASGFRNMFKFTGRASRTEFWYFILFYTLVFYPLICAICFLLPFFMLKIQHPITPLNAWTIVSILFFAFITPLIGITVRRLHDTERKGVWVLTYILPLAMTVITIIFSFLHMSIGERTETETSFNPAEHYNRFTDAEGDTIKVYPHYMDYVRSGKRIVYYKENGDPIMIEPDVWEPLLQADPTINNKEKHDQKLYYGTVGVVIFMEIIKFIGFILLIIFCSFPGTEGPNKYGPDPNVVTQLAQETL